MRSAASAIERARIVHERRGSADPRRQRQAPCEPVIEAVDRLHVQARGIVLEAPVRVAAALERGRGMAVQFPRALICVRRQGLSGEFERGNDAVAHLGRRLARERDRDDLLRPLHVGEQPQVAHRQEGRLAGAGGCLHDAGAGRLHGALPRLAVERDEVMRHRRPPLRRRPPWRVRRGRALPGGTADRCPPPVSDRRRRARP